VGDQRGKREGVVGYLKVRSGRRNGQGVKGFEEGSNSGRFRFPGREERTGEEGPDMWVRSVSGRGGPDERGPPVGGGTRERGIPFRV
jgi:hypothetical protein